MLRDHAVRRPPVVVRADHDVATGDLHRTHVLRQFNRVGLPAQIAFRLVVKRGGFGLLIEELAKLLFGDERFDDHHDITDCYEKTPSSAGRTVV